MASVANFNISPSPLAPVFGLVTVTATGASQDVTVTMTCDGTSYTDTRSPKSGAVAFDIAPYLRAFFAGASATTRIKVVTVKVAHGAQSTDYTLYALFASSSPAFPLGAPITQRIYTAYPKQKFTLLADTTNKTFSVYNKQGVATTYNLNTGYNDLTASEYLAEGCTVYYKSYAYKFVADACECGQMFKWIDRQGFIRYFMLQEGEMTTTTKDKGENIYSTESHTTPLGTFRTEQTYPVGFEMEITKKYCATFTTEEDRTLLESIYTAQYAWMVDKEDNGQRVKIKRGKVSTAKGLQDFEIEVVLPAPQGLSV